MKTLKPSIALSHHVNTTEYTLDVTFFAETGLFIANDPKPEYGSPIPVDPDPDPDMGKGSETLIRIFLEGEKGSEMQVITLQFPLSKAEIKKNKDIRVRVHCKHEDQNHQGTSSGQYGDPK